MEGGKPSFFPKERGFPPFQPPFPKEGDWEQEKGFVERKEESNKGLLLDIPEERAEEKGRLGFKTFCDGLVNIIKTTTPHFTMGIFGTWGTGKTSLMKMMKTQLEQEKFILPVWFNPWRYEKEEHLIVPLLQTIKAETKEKEGWDEKIKAQLSTLVSSLGKAGAALIGGLKLKIAYPLLPISISLSGKDALDKAKDLAEENQKRTEELDSFYYNLLEKMKKPMIDLRKDYPQFRYVIFIDDLDRCFPPKALQILEATKTFLDMDGFILVLGLDKDVIERWIDIKYEKQKEKVVIKGADYIKKIIQVPFTLPPTSPSIIDEYIDNLIEKLVMTL